MRRFKPIHGILVVLVFLGIILVADLALEGRLGGSRYERVSPDREGMVRVDVADLQPLEVRYFRFLNTGNQEVKFFVGRDGTGELQVAFDASESHARVGRGFRHEVEWMVDNKCDTAVRLAEVNAGGGGCRPVPLAHRVRGDELLLAETDILQGWRYFR